MIPVKGKGEIEAWYLIGPKPLPEGELAHLRAM